jgi:gliding motility-associated-like protein
MVLDACRNNPFKNIFKDLSAETWKQPTVVPSGSITCFAASQGEKAIEGHLHSPYTELFLKHINTPGLKIEDLFKRIRIDLIELRKNNPQINQEPVEMNKLTTEFYFVPEKDGSATKPELEQGVKNTDLSTLKILSTANGTIKIDGELKGTIQENEIKVFKLEPGEYFVQLFTEKDNIPYNEEIKLSASKTETLKFDILNKNQNISKTEPAKSETNKVENNAMVISVNDKKLEVYKADLDEMSFSEAEKACAKLGAGWRLPTNVELEELFYRLNKNGKGNFKSDDYWSSTPTSYGNWAFNFRNGSNHNGSSKETKHYVRMVREYCKDCPDNVNIIKNTDNTIKYSCNIKTKDNSVTIIYNYTSKLSDHIDIGPCYYKSNFNLTIYDRWGKILYKKYNLNSNWDGRHGDTDQLLEDGTYFFLMEANSLDGTNIVIRGDLTIIRN